LLWIVYALAIGDQVRLGLELDKTITATARVTFFLLGAMTIVEVIDAHDGFAFITSRIRTPRLTRLLWIASWVTFFLSAILDNLTTTIVMVSLIRKLLDRGDDRLLLASVVVIAANAEGAWSPMGYVTTTMLWIGGQVTASAIIKALLAASLVNLLIPLIFLTVVFRAKPFHPAAGFYEARDYPSFERNAMLALGLGVLVLVPAFKQITHLPPFMGILFGLGILWVVGEVLHKGKPPETRYKLTLAHALTRIDRSSLLFFVGILLAVATMEHAGILDVLAGWLDRTIGRQDIIVCSDLWARPWIMCVGGRFHRNVPTVAASDRRLSLGVHGLLCRNRWLDPDHWIGRGCGGDGHRED
jgi:Na+/H+ antiporter NhaD/arsenite permease-like protein